MVRNPSTTQKEDSMDKRDMKEKAKAHTKDGKISWKQASTIMRFM
jgi:hypothetical protein